MTKIKSVRVTGRKLQAEHRRAQMQRSKLHNLKVYFEWQGKKRKH